MGALIFTLIGALVVILCGAWLVKVLWEDENEDETYEPTGATFIQTLAPSYGESEEAFRTRLIEQIKSDYKLKEGDVYGFGRRFNSKYYIAGVKNYVSEPLVSYGIATRDKNNQYSSRAVALFTRDSKLVGYIPEAVLDSWYNETKGETIPIVIQVYREQGEILGRVYTYADNSTDYERMADQYMYLLAQY